MQLLFNKRIVKGSAWGFLLSAALWSLCVQVAYGANEVGNGGNALDCGTKAELLDLFEARTLRSATLITVASKVEKQKTPPTSNDLLREAIDIALSRIETLSKIDERSARVFSKFLELLGQETQFVTQLDLVAINDSKHLIKPEGCQVKQLAILRKNISAGEKRVLIQEPLWKRIALLDRVGLVLHEAIYRHFADLGQKDSIHARFLVGFLLSTGFSESSKSNYWTEIQRMKIPIYNPEKGSNKKKTL
jgi:hypothetical protein